jgi:hypothetical protein
MKLKLSQYKEKMDLQVREQNKEQNVPIIRQNLNGVPPAAKYMTPDTKEYYYLALNQYTISPFDIDENLDLLNTVGLELYYETLKRLSFEKFKGVFTKYFLERTNSGLWVNNVSSPFYNPEECNAILNSFNNFSINGFLESGERISTSSVIFLTSEWCLTRTGSIYKLNGQVEPYEF